MQDLEQDFAGSGIKRGGILLLSATNAIAFIEAARQRQIPILGIDSFIITDVATQPLMEHILDLSVGDWLADTWTEARRFVEDRKNLGFRFEVVA